MPNVTQDAGKLWNSAPTYNEIMLAPWNYIHIFEHFNQGFDSTATTGSWVATQATAGTAAQIDGNGGLLELDSNSATQGQGIQVQSIKEFFKPTAGKRAWFEAKLKLTDTVGGAQSFVGFSILDTTLIASNANSSTDHIGFEAIGTAALSLVTEASGSRTTAGTSPGTLVEDTYHTLGLFIDGTGSAHAYFDGNPVSGSKVTSNIPTTELALSFVCQTNGTVDPIITIDWFRFLCEL